MAARRPDYSGANYGGSPQTWQGPRGASSGGGNGQNGYVWWDRNWVPAGEHPGSNVYQYPTFIEPDSTPYYANDVTSALMQQAFPGAAAGYGFASSQLEPRRQQNIMDMLNLTTQQGASGAADAYAKAVGQQAYGQARQSAAGLYGPGGGSKRFQASNLLANMNKATDSANAYRANVTDPGNMLARRQQILMGGYQNPLADQIRGWIPGLEPARQDNNFWSQLAGVGSQILPYVNFKPQQSGGGTQPYLGWYPQGQGA